jgi:hypothetical protein
MVVAEFADVCKQRSGQEVFWLVHHVVLRLRETEFGLIVWAATRAAERSGRTDAERMIMDEKVN